MNHKFVVFYVSVVSVALVGSLYANILNPSWRHAVFTFPPEVQKVVVNGTATMEIWWRWLPDTLEMVIKVNDNNETYNSDLLGLLFDTDHSGNLTTNVQRAQFIGNDYGVFVDSQNNSGIMEQCFIMPPHDWGANAVMWTAVWGSPYVPVLKNLNNTYCVYKEGEGYMFHLRIPREVIDVSPPTPIHMSFLDNDALAYIDALVLAYNNTLAYLDLMGQEVIAADFEG